MKCCIALRTYKSATQVKPNSSAIIGLIIAFLIFSLHYTENNNPSAYNQATFYSYDILGNVDILLQDYGCNTCGAPAVYNMMNRNVNRYKKFVYQYDLISGKVNMAMYQPGWSDMFLHRYTYDSENRLTLVETSNAMENTDFDFLLSGIAMWALGQKNESVAQWKKARMPSLPMPLED